MDYTVHGILQARVLQWVAIPFFKGFSQPRDQTQVSHIAGGFLPEELPGKLSNQKRSEQWIAYFQIMRMGRAHTGYCSEHGLDQESIIPHGVM